MSGSASLFSTIRYSTCSPHRPIQSRSKFTILSLATVVEARKPSNLYQVLRIKETSSQIEIKTAYRSLAKRFHPDAGSDGRDFMEIHNAYATLSDPTAKALYDRSIGAFNRFPKSRFHTRKWETDQCW